MERAKSFGRENISENLPKSFEDEAIEVDDDNSKTISIEYIADKVSFHCVWQQPEVNMQLINEFMNGVNVDSDHEYGDFTPSNMSDLMSAISASFPSGSINEMDLDDATSYYEPSTSTPMEKTSSNEASANLKMNFGDFQDASPIMFTSRQRQVFKLRRCRLSFEDDSYDVECKRKVWKKVENEAL